MDTNLKKSTTVKGYTNGKIKVMRFIGMLLIAVILFTIPVFASANYGEKGGTWILDQIFWVGLVVVAIVFIKFFMAGNFTKMLITAGVGALTLTIIKNPQRLQQLGDAMWTTIIGA